MGHRQFQGERGAAAQAFAAGAQGSAHFFGGKGRGVQSETMAVFLVVNPCPKTRLRFSGAMPTPLSWT